jgi:hypothetical protein
MCSPWRRWPSPSWSYLYHRCDPSCDAAAYSPPTSTLVLPRLAQSTASGPLSWDLWASQLTLYGLTLYEASQVLGSASRMTLVARWSSTLWEGRMSSMRLEGSALSLVICRTTWMEDPGSFHDGVTRARKETPGNWPSRGRMLMEGRIVKA